MKSKHKITSLAAAALLVLGSGAFADTAIFDFTSASVVPGTPPPTFFNTGMLFTTTSTGGHPFAAIAFGQGIVAADAVSILSIDAYVTQTAAGLGVLTPGYDTTDLSDPNILTDFQIDGNNRFGLPGIGADMLILAFPANVAVNTVLFTLGGGGDEAAASVRIDALFPGSGANLEIYSPITVTALPGGVVAADFTGLSNRTGLAFGFTVANARTAYDVAAISVDFDPAVVPLPSSLASGGLLLAGLGGLKLVRQRRLATVRA